MNSLLILSAVLVLLGFIGTVLPALPGVALVFAGLALGAWAEDFRHVGWITIVVLIALTVLAFVVDFAATTLGAKRVGASKYAMLGAALGTFGGLWLGLPGLLVGPFVGAVAGELLTQRNNPHRSMAHAGRVGLGAWVGLLMGSLTKLVIACAMVSLFGAVYYFHP